MKLLEIVKQILIVICSKSYSKFLNYLLTIQEKINLLKHYCTLLILNKHEIQKIGFP